MGSPTPGDDDPTRRLPDPGGWPPPGQGHPYPGGPYPPSGQYPPPGAGGPAPTLSFPQPGGHPGGFYPPGPPYPPQGPGAGYGAPPPGRGGGGRGLLIALGVGLVLLAGVAVALVIALTRDGSETASAEPSGAPSDASTSEAPTSSEPPPSPTETAPSGPTSAADRTEELLATVPADFSDCRPRELAGDGDVAAVECGPSTTQPGPQTAAFYLYEDPGTLDRVFAEEAAGVDPMPEGENCSTAQGVTTWEVAGVEGGEVGCIITEDGLLLAWSDREFGIEGIVTAPGSTQEELAALAEWWTANSAYQG